MADFVIDLAAWRERGESLRAQLAELDARRELMVSAIRDNDTLIATAIAPEQPLLPIEGLQRRSGRRATTRHGRAVGAELNATDRKVLRIIEKGPIGLRDLAARSKVNVWTLRDSIARLQVAGHVKRFGLARATRFAKAGIKTEQAPVLGFLTQK